MKKHIGLFTLIISVLTSQVNAHSAFEKPENAIEYQQVTFQIIIFLIKDMDGIQKGKVEFDAACFQKRAENAAAL